MAVRTGLTEQHVKHKALVPNEYYRGADARFKKTERGKFEATNKE